MRAQEKAVLVDETLSLLAKVTGKDEASMRPKFEGMKLEDLRRERDRWRKRAEEKQRLRGKKEEAWELFQRQPRLGASRREEFEREYKQKVTTKRLSPFDLGSPDADEKSLQEWVDKLLVQALAQDRKEARERPEHGAGGFQLPKTPCMGEDMGSASARPVDVSCSWKLSRDVSLDVELTA